MIYPKVTIFLLCSFIPFCVLFKGICINIFYSFQEKYLLNIVCVFYGYKKIENSDRIKKLLFTLEETLPQSNVYFLIDHYAEIDGSIQNYNLNIHFEYVNCTFSKEDIKHLYDFQDSFKSWIFTYRYKFYQDFLVSHKDLKYIMFIDSDTLILKDPLPILKEDINSIHVMYDYLPFSIRSHINFQWLNVITKLSNKTKKKCNLLPIQYNSKFDMQIPLNSGLILGEYSILIKFLSFFTQKALCINVIPGICDQGLLNYLYYSSDILINNITIHPHSMHEHFFISCPDRFNQNEFNSSISNQWIVLHHYQTLYKSNISNFNNRIQKLLEFI